MNNRNNFHIKTARPEEEHNISLEYFKGENVERYALSKAIMNIQEKITERALELLDIGHKSPRILDLGCGPGFSSLYLKLKGYNVVSLDLNSSFLYYYYLSDINPILADMTVLPFKNSSFDAVISISTLQWISKNKHKLYSLFKSLNDITRIGAKLVIQFYPKSNNEIDKIKEVVNLFAQFNGGFVIDNPQNPKKRKIYLLLKKSH